MSHQKVAKAQTETAQTTSSKLESQRSTLLGGSAVERRLFLQNGIGNQAVLRLLARRKATLAGSEARSTNRNQTGSSPPAPSATTVVQTKLEVGSADDPLEHEADRVADQVMRMEEPESARNRPSTIQRLGSAQEEITTNHLQRLCTECQEEEEGAALHRKTISTGVGVGGNQLSSQAEARINAVSGGQPLPKEERAVFEPRFGVDFSRVRIHADAAADTAARAVGALAFTRGSDIVFRENQYRPPLFRRAPVAHARVDPRRTAGGGFRHSTPIEWERHETHPGQWDA